MNQNGEQEKSKAYSQLVVKGNELIQKKRYNLTATQQKFLAYVISRIKPDDTIATLYEIRVEDFCSMTGIDKTYFYDEFIKMIDRFDEQSFWIDTEDELYKFRWFNDTRYIKGAGKVDLYLSRALKDYLFELKSNFTQYELYNVMALHSKYAIRLFELFKSYEYQHYKTFDTEDLKHLLYAENYKNFADFKKRVLEPAIDEINNYTELNVSFEPVFKGRKVIQIAFKIKLKDTMDRYIAYTMTRERIDRDNDQITGEMTIYDIIGVEE